MPSIVTRGSFSGKAFGLTGQTATPVYIEDVFSTYLYTGNGSTQTITNNIDLSTKGGMVWAKKRNGADDHVLWDTARGREWALNSNQTVQQQGPSGAGTDLTSFNTSGFSLGTSSYDGKNDSGATYASWTFRKQPKFFDVVTFTAGFADQTVNHSLGSTPGMIIIKATASAGQNWYVYHKSIPSNFLALNLTNAVGSPAAATSVNSSSFVFNGAYYGAGSSATYVAYLFADQAGGFGLSGTDSVVACGSLTTNGSGNATVSLGWEPQFVLYKNSGTAGTSWQIVDNMRGMSYSDNARLFPNSSGAELTGSVIVTPTATGFNFTQTASSTYIYLAIRRGPMKVPTSGTSVFSPITYTGDGTNSRYISGFNFPLDMFLFEDFSGYAGYNQFIDRLRGGSSKLQPSTTAAEVTNSSYYSSALDRQNGYTGGTQDFNQLNSSGVTFAVLGFRRAPSFLDVVCYTGTGSATTVAHNLGVAPEFILVKGRSGTGTGLNWTVYAAPLGANTFMVENDGQEAYVGYPTIWNNTTPTASVFSVGTANYTNGPSNTFVAYLFATCPGVSKVGSYTGTGAAQNIDCGFSAGARFVLIKRTDSAGGWYVYDSARGISSGNDPYLLLNSTAAQVTGTNYVDTFASGFTLTATAPAALNANGGSYIFLAIA